MTDPKPGLSSLRKALAFMRPYKLQMALATLALVFTAGVTLALVQFVGIMFLTDVVQYWVHRAFHRVPWLWRFHAVHHSSERLDWLASVRGHPVNDIVANALGIENVWLGRFKRRDASTVQGASLRDLVAAKDEALADRAWRRRKRNDPDLADDEAGTDAHPHYERMLRIRTVDVDRARELVREILRFSRKDPASKEPLRLDELVTQALPIIRAGIPKTTKIVAEMTEVPEILGSKGQIYQTLLNLVTNAARAIGTKHGTITINVRHDPGGDVVLTVADDGIGMDEATRTHIFEPFFTRHANAGGTGLGLSIVNGIVLAHGGSISVASSPGVGTRFELKFPVQRMMEAA